MNISLPKFITALWERDKAGNNWYYVDGGKKWGFQGTNLWKAQNHPILTPAMLFVSKLYSQAEFYLEDQVTKKKYYTHPILDKLKKPNYYQTGMDFLESQMFMQIAQGKAVMYVKRSIGLTEPKAIYLLDSDLITWPEEFKTPMRNRSYDAVLDEVVVVYDKDKENLKIKLKDLLFFYDSPNSLQENKFEVSSRLDGLDQTLINTCDSLLAKNIILKTNGKELITQKKSGFPLDQDEKQDAEALFNTGYGLSSNRKRGLVTRAELTWQSLHIALRDLGLDESVKVDGNLIYTALHIPKDILSLEAKKTTYNNFKESMVSYIQNEMQPSADATCAVLQQLIETPNLKLRASFEHLPIMQFILLEFYDGKKKLGEALLALRNAGIPDEVALELLRLDPNMKLKEIQKPTTNGNETNTQGGETETD